jgi:hypothetical protein
MMNANAHKTHTSINKLTNQLYLMKNLFFLLFLALPFVATAQYVTIPDANFRTFLQGQYPQCFNAQGQMDTTCNAVVTETYVNCAELNISSIEGIQYFDNLDWLDCWSNKLTFLPKLPNSLRALYILRNQLTVLPNLPDNLEQLICPINAIVSLPILPNKLRNLVCSLNQISELPSLPDSLRKLECTYNQISVLPTLPDSLKILQANNNPLSCISFLPKSLTYLRIDSTQISCLPNIPQGIAITNTLPLCLPSNPNGCLFAARIYGSIKKAVNCAATTQNLPNMLVTATNTATSEIYVANSDTSGGYEIAVPTGTYTVSVAPPNGYWGVCTNAQNIVITQSGQQKSRDVLLNAVVACADMSIRHTDAAVMRPCTTSVYRVSYFNAGTIAAAGAYAEITLAAEQTFVSASLPSLALGNGRFRFELPTVAALQRGVFEVNVQVACSITMGQQLCTDIEVFPHTFCNPPALWDGSDVTVSGRCVGNNQVRFVLTNTGAGAMSAPQTYSIIEDNLMIRSGQIQLLVAGSDSVTITADPLRVYRIVVNESPYNPAGNTQETVLVWGCNGLSPNIHWGAVNQYPLNSGADYIHYLCTTVRTSFDPNDISAVPTGVGAQHFIENNTVLDYKIRFQNTGNDTAFVVRLLNQLPPELDKTTLKIGAASHPFTYSLKANGVLEFLFTNIRLEDSTSNEPKSHGFVTYSIKTKPNLAIGTTIQNQANIYFDTNAPVATNIYTHTIGEIVVGTVQSIDNQYFTIKIIPNPMHDVAVFEMNYPQSYQQAVNNFKANLVLYNVLGHAVLSQNFIDGKLLLERNNLPQGCYFYKINNANGLLTQGKLMMN